MGPVQAVVIFLARTPLTRNKAKYLSPDVEHEKIYPYGYPKGHPH
jgi:hypothetical protein